MKKDLKVLSLMLAFVFVIIVFAGCGAENAGGTGSTASATSTVGQNTESTQPVETNYQENGLPKDQQVTLKVGFFDNANGHEWYDACVQSFTQKFPNVKFDTLYSPTITDIAKTKLAANDDAGMFDIFSYGWLNLVNDGRVEPIDDLFDRALYDTPDKKLKDVLIPGVYENLTFYKDKHLYYMPITSYVGGLFFDEAFFDQNGWNKNPKTWDEFVKLCADIKSKGIMPIAYAGIYQYDNFAFTPKQFELAAMNGNGDYLTNFRNYKMPYFTSPEITERWNRESQLGKLGYIDKSSVAINHTQSQMMMIQHKTAMVPSGDWVESEMKDSTPAGFKWGYMAVPFVNDPSQTIYVSNGISNSYVIYSKKPDLNKKWAKEFMLWLCNRDSQVAILQKGGAMPIRKDLGDTSTLSLTTCQKAVSNYVANNNVAFVDIFGSDIGLTDPNYNKAFKLYGDNNSLMATGQKDPGPILAECDKTLQKAVDAYNNGTE